MIEWLLETALNARFLCYYEFVFPSIVFSYSVDTTIKRQRRTTEKMKIVSVFIKSHNDDDFFSLVNWEDFINIHVFFLPSYDV